MLALLPKANNAARKVRKCFVLIKTRIGAAGLYGARSAAAVQMAIFRWEAVRGKQLRGSMSFATHNGAAFTVDFLDTAVRKAID